MIGVEKYNVIRLVFSVKSFFSLLLFVGSRQILDVHFRFVMLTQKLIDEPNEFLSMFNFISENMTNKKSRMSPLQFCSVN
jgi:hypothetical protein